MSAAVINIVNENRNNHEGTRTKQLITESLHWLSIWYKIRNLILSDTVIIVLIHYNIYILASVFDIAFHIMLILNIVLIWSVQQYLCGRTIYSLKDIPVLSLRNTVKTFYAWHCTWIKSLNYICNKPKFLLSVCSFFTTQTRNT